LCYNRLLVTYRLLSPVTQKTWKQQKKRATICFQPCIWKWFLKEIFTGEIQQIELLNERSSNNRSIKRTDIPIRQNEHSDACGTIFCDEATSSRDSLGTYIFSTRFVIRFSAQKCTLCLVPPVKLLSLSPYSSSANLRDPCLYHSHSGSGALRNPIRPRPCSSYNGLCSSCYPHPHSRLGTLWNSIWLQPSILLLPSSSWLWLRWSIWLHCPHPLTRWDHLCNTCRFHAWDGLDGPSNSLL
jgi:hypothetical protein